MSLPTHRQEVSIEIENIDGDPDDHVTANDIDETIAMVEVQMNKHKREGNFSLSSGKIVTWSYLQPVN